MNSNLVLICKFLKTLNSFPHNRAASFQKPWAWLATTCSTCSSSREGSAQVLQWRWPSQDQTRVDPDFPLIQFSYLDQTSTSSLPYALSSSWDIVRRPKTTSFLQELRESGCTTTIRRRTARASLPGRRNWRVVQPGGGDQGQAWWNVWGEIKKRGRYQVFRHWESSKVSPSSRVLFEPIVPTQKETRRQAMCNCVSSSESDYLCEDLRCTWSSVGVAPIR